MKTLKFSILLVGIMFAFSSCKDKEKNNLDNTNIDLKSASCSFFGDPDGYNLYYYDLTLLDENLTRNKNGSGTMVFLALNSKRTDRNMVSSGTYNANTATTPQEFTFERGSWSVNQQTGQKNAQGSYVGMVFNGQIIKYLITSGSVIITNNAVSGIVATEDNKKYRLNFSGEISIENMVVPLPETLTKGEIWYWGNAFNNNLNVFTIRLAANNVSLSDFSGSGDAMQIEVYTPLSVTTFIPDGTYPIKKIEDKLEYTALRGVYNAQDKAYYGTVYYTADKLLVDKGAVTIAHKDGNTYNLDFNFTDDYYGYSALRKFDIELPFVKKQGNAPKQIRAQSVENIKNQRSCAVKSPTFNRYERSNRATLSEINKR